MILHVIICPPSVVFPLVMYYSNFVYCRLGTETKIITTLDQNERWTCIQDREEDNTRQIQLESWKIFIFWTRYKFKLVNSFTRTQGQILSLLRFCQNCFTNLPAFHIYYMSSYQMHRTLSKTLFSVLLYVKLYLLSSKQVWNLAHFRTDSVSGKFLLL